ncbi:hypothetical protein F511_24133 [Dorcoceras hygrometricum]|uniref:Uncharacterized protein n=1 Tax=Dorcoceras hygrometricum TaxID=472368 RepID=A0A2Z7BY69_9LAMI|nr:hypothetical protein F511_24133 [Dorcoceras hygrometricum]
MGYKLLYIMFLIKNPLAAILDSNKFNDTNYQDWFRNLKIVFASEKLFYTLEKSPPKEAHVNASPKELAKLEKLSGLVLISEIKHANTCGSYQKAGATAEGYNQGREPKNSMHSSTEICNRICGHDVCMAIGSIATLDLPMVVDLIGIYGLKGPYCTLTTTNWFLQALSVIPRGSWGDVSRRFIMIRWASPEL